MVAPFKVWLAMYVTSCEEQSTEGLHPLPNSMSLCLHAYISRFNDARNVRVGKLYTERCQRHHRLAVVTDSGVIIHGVVPQGTVDRRHSSDICRPRFVLGL